ncbi:MAG: hypothetical protein IKK86_01765 [Alistipes sp.]|nr:hypothetical protein [Alistipes sp.]
MHRLLISLFVAVCVVACCSTPTEVLPLQAEECMAEQPDSARAILQAMDLSLTRKPELVARHALFEAQLLIEQEKPIYPDSLLKRALAYYADHDKPAKYRARAYFYAGHSYRERQMYPEAMAHYVEAERSVRHSDDVLLKGRIMAAIGGLYRKQYHLRSSVECFEEAVACFKQVEHRPFILRGMMGLSVDYNAMHKHEMKRYYRERSWELARELQDTMAQIYLVRAEAVDLLAEGRFREAIDLFHASADRYCGGVIPSDYCYGMALSYLRLKEYDSAAIYLQKRIADSEEQRRREELYDQTLCHWNVHNEWLLGEFDAATGDFRDAFRHKSNALRTVDSMYRAEKYSSLPSMRGRTLRSYLAEENEDLNRRVVMHWILGVIFICAVVFFFLWRRDHRKKLEALYNQEIAEYRESIITLRHAYLAEQTRPRAGVDAGVIERRVEFLRKVLDTILLYNHKTETLSQKVTALFGVDSSEAKVSWMFEDILNMRQPGVVEFLRRNYPQLTEREVHIYNMICLDMSKSAICMVQNISPKTYYNLRNFLRGKLQLENNETFADHFEKLCKACEASKKME